MAGSLAVAGKPSEGQAEALRHALGDLPPRRYQLANASDGHLPVGAEADHDDGFGATPFLELDNASGDVAGPGFDGVRWARHGGGEAEDRFDLLVRHAEVNRFEVVLRDRIRAGSQGADQPPGS